MDRDEVGTYLSDFGEDFRVEGAARVELDDDVVSVNPSDDVEFEVTVEEVSESDGKEMRHLSFELMWEKTEYDEDLSS